MRSWDRTLSSDFRALPGTSHATHPPGPGSGACTRVPSLLQAEALGEHRIGGQTQRVPRRRRWPTARTVAWEEHPG